MGQPADARVFRIVRAATELCSPDNANRVAISELVECLKRGNESRHLALIAEYAATALYARTGRQWTEGSLAVTDTDDWMAYLKKHGFI